MIGNLIQIRGNTWADVTSKEFFTGNITSEFSTYEEVKAIIRSVLPGGKFIWFAPAMALFNTEDEIIVIEHDTQTDSFWHEPFQSAILNDTFKR